MSVLRFGPEFPFDVEPFRQNLKCTWQTVWVLSESPHPPQQKCLFNKKSKKYFEYCVYIAHTQTGGFVRRWGLLEQRVWHTASYGGHEPPEAEARWRRGKVCYVICCYTQRQISLYWLYCHSFLRSVWAYKTKLSTKSIVPRELQQISKGIASETLPSIAVFFALLSLLPQYQHLQNKAMLSLQYL